MREETENPEKTLQVWLRWTESHIQWSQKEKAWFITNMPAWGPVHTYPEIFVSANFFYADTPSVHTCPPYTLGVSGDFCIRSPEWKFLCTLCIRIRVDARIRVFLYTLTSQFQHQSFSARALLTCPEIRTLFLFQNGGIACFTGLKLSSTQVNWTFHDEAKVSRQKNRKYEEAVSPWICLN